MPNQRNPVFSVYLEKYLVNGEVVNGPDLVMTVPTSDPRSVWMVNPSYKAEMGKAESFDFSINPKAPYYNAFIQMQTRMRIFYDDRVIFYGRITTVNTSSLLQVRAIHAEGIYAVLRDTTQLGLEEELQAKTTAAEQFGNIISAHNGQLGLDTWKHVSVGVIDSSGLSRDMNFSKAKKRGSTSCATTISAIDGLIGNHGGYTRMRYELANQNDKASAIDSRLDWLKDYFYDATEHGASRPHIQIAKNLIDFSSSSELGEIFTRVIPIGHKASSGSSSSSSSSDSGSSSSSTKKKTTDYIYLSPNYIKVSDICGVYSDAVLNSGFHRKSDYQNAENNYGVIYKSVNFQNAYNAELLREYANDWIKNNYFGGIRSFSVKAVDMHMVDPDGPAIFVGDVVDFTYPEYDSNGDTVLITRKLVCKSIQMNLFAPDQNSYTLGIPSDTLDFEYGEKKKTGKASSTIANNASVGGGSPAPKKVVDFDSVKKYLLWFYYSAPWETYTASINNHAYSWRSEGLTNITNKKDKEPYNTCKDYRIVNVKSDGEEEEISFSDYNAIYGHAQTFTREVIENGERVTKYYYIPKNEEVSYNYANFHYEGKDVGSCRIICHYRTSPCRNLIHNPEIPGDVRNKIPANHATSHHYGIAVKEGTLDIFAFDWADYHINGPSIEIKFYFPEYPGGTYKSCFEGGESSNNLPATDPPVGEADEEGGITFFDEHGYPTAQVFPNLGTMRVSDAYYPNRWEDDDGNEISEEDLPNHPDAHPMPIFDDDGNRIWSIAINEPIKTLNPAFDPSKPIDATTNPKYVTIGGKGFISTNDIALPSIPSFRTEVAVIHDAIINRATIGELYANVATLGNAEVTYDDDGNIIGCNGVQLQTNLNGIYGVSSIFEKNADGSLKTDDEGHPIVSDSYGGLSIDHDGVALGIYHAGNLTGGLMVKKINKQTVTTLRGDVINLDTGVDKEGNATGHIKLTDVMTIRAAGGTTIKSDTYFDGDIYLSSGSSGGRSWSGNISASNAVIRNKIIFSDPDISNINNAPALTLSKMGKSHVKVVDGDSENTYVLKYLPAYLDPDTASEAEWIVSGNFNRAASGGALTASWSGSSPRNNLIIADESHAHEYVINFGNSRQISGKTINDIIEVINIDDNGDEYENTVSTASYSNGKYLVVPYRIVKTTPSTGAEDDSYTTIFNGVLGAVNATPVYDNGWNAAADVAALNPVIVNSQVTKDLHLVKPRKNYPGTSQTVGYYVDVDTNYAYVKDPNDTVVAKVDNTAADRNRSSRIGNNVPNYYNVSDDEYDNASADHKFALTRYSSRYSVVTQYQKRDGTYANGDVYYITTPADRYTDGQNDIINAGGPISQNGAVSNRAINKYVTTLTVTGINATGNISITNRNYASTEAILASSLGAPSASALSNMFTSNPATYNQFYGIKVECPSASNTPQYYYFKTPVDRYDSGHSAGYNDGRNSITKSNIDVNSWSWYDSSASLPSSDATLSSMGNLIKKSKRGYVYFTVSVLNASKRYRIPINTA